MRRLIVTAALGCACWTGGVAAARPQGGAVVKVPCRDMGDGRTLVDSSYLPSWFKAGRSTYTILATAPASTAGKWANRVCTLRVVR
jgi:hypothetical protein